MSDNPYASPQSVDSGSGGPDQGMMLAKIAAPAIAVLVVGILNILFSLFGVGSSALTMAGLNPLAEQQKEQFEQMRQTAGPEAEFVNIMTKVSEIMQGPGGLVSNLITLVVGIFIVLGALKMKRLESYGMSMTASILAMIPCLSNCCVVGLPIGIWALIVLMSADIKQSFVNTSTA